MNANVLFNGFRGVLVVLRWLFILGAILSQVRFFTGAADLDVAVFAAPTSIETKGTLSDGAGVAVRGVLLQISVPVRADQPELRKLAYLSTMPRVLVIAAAGFIACQIMLSLLANIRRGQLFAPANGRRLWGLAGVLIAAPVVQGIVLAMGERAMGRYLLEHLQVSAWKILPQIDSIALREFSLNTNGWEVTIIGLLFLVLLQAFREGAALKQDNELTV